jgi:hypothetical protein
MPSMSQQNVVIPIDHRPAIHEVPMDSDHEAQSLTLLELVDAVSEVSESEQEILATVAYMLKSGRVRLAGTFRDQPAENLCG